MDTPRASEAGVEGASSVLVQSGQPFNPRYLFNGVFVPDGLVRYRGLSPTAKFLWARLARYAGEDGRVYPAVPTLAAELGLSDRQVQRGLAALERGGFIRRHLRKTARGDYTSTSYEFLLHPVLLQTLRPESSQTPGLSPNEGVVTHVSPPGDATVTTNMKRRLEEKTSSSSRSSFSPSPTPSPKAWRDDEDQSETAQLRFPHTRRNGGNSG